MKTDIPHPRVEGIAMAVVRERDPESGHAWHVYLINQKEVAITNVLIASQGYGQIEGKDVKTSELRHFLERLEPRSYARIERIMEDVFPLNNQYWLSFYIGHLIYDKKYIFVPESIVEENFTAVPLMNKRGVMIE
jgi:hypothetical protein